MIVLPLYSRRLRRKEWRRCMRYIDLSHVIEDKMSVHHYDSEVTLYQDKFLDLDKYNNFRLDIGTHVGTHIDSPMHLSDNNLFISDYDIEKFCGSAVVIDVRGQGVIKFMDSYIEIIKDNDIVLFYTGHEEKFGTDEYYSDYPMIDIGIVNVLIKKKVKLIGLDSPSPDKYPFQIHKKLFANGIFIVENLKNLGQLVDKSSLEVFMFPLKIKADASLIRAVAKICD